MKCHLFISPHFDDACFSLANYISGHRNLELINVFTQCNFIAKPLPHLNFSLGVNSVEAITKLRDGEDERFALKYSITRTNLNLAEATVCGLHPFDLGDLNGEIKLLNQTLIKNLFEKAREKKSAEVLIYCPMGIGGHRNHLSILLSVLKNYEALSAVANIFFYEDMPYAVNSEARMVGISQFQKFFNNVDFRHHVKYLSTKELQIKLEDVALYMSQDPFQNEKDVINSMDFNLFRVESFWSICPKS